MRSGHEALSRAPRDVSAWLSEAEAWVSQRNETWRPEPVRRPAAPAPAAVTESSRLESLVERLEQERLARRAAAADEERRRREPPVRRREMKDLADEIARLEPSSEPPAAVAASRIRTVTLRTPRPDPQPAPSAARQAAELALPAGSSPFPPVLGLDPRRPKPALLTASLRHAREADAAEATQTAHNPSASALAEEMQALREQLEAALDRTASLPPRSPEAARLTAEIRSLGGELDALCARLELTDQLTEGGRVTGRRARSARLRQHVSALRDGAEPPAPTSRNVEQALGELSVRIGRVAAATPADPDAVGALQSGLDDIRARIATLDRARDSTPLDGTRRALDALCAKIDGMAERVGADALSTVVSREMGAIADRLAAEMRTEVGAPVGALNNAVEDLAVRLERIGRRTDDDTAAFDQIQLSLAGVASRLEAAVGDGKDLDAVCRAVEDLAARLERAEERGFDAAVAMEKALERATARLEMGGGGNLDVTGLERGLAEILRQLEDGRSVSADVARSAATRAVQETLAETGDGLQFESLARAIADLRESSASGQRRTYEALAGVRDVLERLAANGGRSDAAPALPEASPTERARAAAQKAVAEAQATGTVAPVLKLGPTHAARREAAAAVRAERGRFIAAARRSLAAEADDPDTALPPAAEAGSRAASLFRFHTRRAAPAESTEDLAEELAESAGSGAGIRRPVLIALAATVVLLCSWQAARTIFDRAPVVAAVQGPKPVATAAVPPPDAAPVRKVETTEQVASLAPSSSGWTAAATAPKEPSFAAPSGGLDSGSVAAELAAVAAEPAAHDPMITGSIPTPLAPPRAEAAIPTEVTGRLRQRATSGDAAAQYEIGARLADGRKLGRDPAKAAAWFELAAAQGLAPAQYRLGSLYEKGNGVTKNLATAESWYLKAADAGNIRSMHNLGVLYAEGGLGSPDYEKAALWFRRAADHGVRDSQYNLGILYARGLGVRQNLPEAFLWLSLAATQGDADAGAKRDQVAAKMSSQALVTAKLAVGTFKPKPVAADANDVAAPSGGWDGAVTAAAQSDKRGAKAKH